jgi:HSP20 family protein
MADAQRPDVQIPVDVMVDGDDYRIVAMIPGINPDDIKIEVLEDVVSIQGEFAAEELEDDVKYLRHERPVGTFGRTLRMPTMLNAAGAEAEVINGILSLRVPKAEEAKAKQIKVKAS